MDVTTRADGLRLLRLTLLGVFVVPAAWIAYYSVGQALDYAYKFDTDALARSYATRPFILPALVFGVLLWLGWRRAGIWPWRADRPNAEGPG